MFADRKVIRAGRDRLVKARYGLFPYFCRYLAIMLPSRNIRGQGSFFVHVNTA